jgi:hypothetical protein
VSFVAFFVRRFTNNMPRLPGRCSADFLFYRLRGETNELESRIGVSADIEEGENLGFVTRLFNHHNQGTPNTTRFVHQR